MYKSIIFTTIILALLAGAYFLWGEDRHEIVLDEETAHSHIDGMTHTH